MMKKSVGLLYSAIAVCLACLTACATAPVESGPPFDVRPIKGGQWVAKVDHLVFILDASSSMAWSYSGRKKFVIAKNIVSHFNQTMPDLDIQVILRAFGMDPFVTVKGTELFFGPQSYSRAGLAEGLESITGPGGPSPMSKALSATGEDLGESQGPIAIVIISDGKDMGAGPLAAAQGLAAQFGDRLCIYTVLVGDNSRGRALLEKIVSTAACGRLVTAESLESGDAMAAFVQEVILGKPADRDGDGVSDKLDKCPNTPPGVKVGADGCPQDRDGDGVLDHLDRCPDTRPRGAPVDKYGCLLDSDGDGVYDYMDKCPGTPGKTQVDATGCPIHAATQSAEVTAAGTWLYSGVQFETNSANLKTSAYPILDEIAAGLQAQPDLRVEIQGYTDSRGSRAYNMDLSERRAKSVREYLIGRGITPDRLSARGYGPDRPIASNNTAEGRSRNRRVELKPIQ